MDQSVCVVFFLYRACQPCVIGSGLLLFRTVLLVAKIDESQQHGKKHKSKKAPVSTHERKFFLHQVSITAYL